MAEPFAKTALRQVILAAPIFLVHQLLSALLGPVLDNRLLLTALAVPLGIGCWVLWKVLSREQGVLLGGRFLAFFLVYALLFGLLTATPLRNYVTPRAEGQPTEGVDWQERLLPGTPAGWLGRFLPAGSIDWRYRLAQGWEPQAGDGAAPAGDLLLLTLPLEGTSRDDLRRNLAFIISQARRRGAIGVALDYYFDVGSDWDRLLCDEFEASAEAGFPVVAGFRYGRQEASPIDDCLVESQRGHVGAILDLDGRLRGLPVFLDRGRQRPALSWRMAEVIGGGETVTEPPEGVVRFLPPETRIRTHVGRPTGADLRKLEGAYILVASDNAIDTHLTPWGPKPGPVLQAWSALSLVDGRYLSRLHPAWSFPTIFALCYLLTVVLARRGGWRRLVLLAGALSALWLAIAALAVRFAGLWIDVAAPLTAVWVLVGLLLVANGVLRGKIARPVAPPALADPAATADPGSQRAFDVFLSHNGDDKPVVRRLADTLEERGLSPWLDERELVPGQPWQEALEEIIVRAGSSAVLVGPNGLGPWETVEMRACLSQFVESRKPVIPVLLPGCPEKPNLPLFLTQFTWVDLRQGLTDAGLDRLEWGVTGRKPRRRAA